MAAGTQLFQRYCQCPPGRRLHYVYVSSSVSKAWTSRYSTTLGANFSMIDYQEDSAKTDNRDYVGMNFTNRYKWTERLAVSLGWTGSYCNREYGNNEFPTSSWPALNTR